MSLRIDISVCRVCCKSKASHSIFQYAKKFHYCTAIEVAENDGLPTKICDACLERMKLAVEFKKKSEFSDRQLRSFIANVNNQFMALEGGGLSEDGEDDDGIMQVEVEVASQENPKQESSQEEQGEETDASEPAAMVEIPKNSALGVKVIHEEDSDSQQPMEEAEPESDPDPVPSPEPEQIQEKFRAVAVIQEKPAIKPEKEIFDIVEVYDENFLPQESLAIQEPEEPEPEQQNPTSGNDSEAPEEEAEQVIYISIPEYQDVQEPSSSPIQFIEDDNSSVVEVEQTEEHYDPNKSSESANTANLETMDLMTLSFDSVKSTSSNKYECTQCSKFFSTRTNLNRHLQTHDGRKPYVCHLCQKGFTQNGSLKQHLFIHQNIRPYVCHICEQGFTQQKSLTFHMRRHTNEKPFVCEFCSYAFRQKDGLKRHLVVKHTEKDAKRFFCDICDKPFQTRYALSTHRKRHEPKEEHHGDAVSMSEGENIQD